MSRAPLDTSIPWRRRLPLLLCLPAAVALDRLAATSPDAVQRLYSQGIYREVAQGSRHVTDRVPFSLTEALIAVAVLLLLYKLVKQGHALLRGTRSLLDCLSHGVVGIAAGAGAFALGFLLLWGLNLHGPTLGSRLGLAPQPADPKALLATASLLAAQADSLRALAPEGADGVFAYPGGHRAAAAAAQAGYTRLAPRLPELGGAFGTPKPLVFSAVTSVLGIGGFFGPPTWEAQFNDEVPDASLLFVICHEMAHQRAVVPENEANFVAWLACRAHPEVSFQYSAAFCALRYTLGPLYRVDPERGSRLFANLSEAVQRDWRDLDTYLRRDDGLMRALGGRAHDAALKVQGQSAGLQTYGLVADLIIAELANEAAEPPGATPTPQLD